MPKITKIEDEWDRNTLTVKIYKDGSVLLLIDGVGATFCLSKKTAVDLRKALLS